MSHFLQVASVTLAHSAPTRREGVEFTRVLPICKRGTEGPRKGAANLGEHALSMSLHQDKKMKRILSVVLALFLSVSPAFSMSKKHEKALAATFVLVGHSDSRGVDRRPLCTAFAYEKLSDGYMLLTEGHCFSGAPDDATFAVAEDLNDNDVQPVQVIRYENDKGNDVAELYLKTKKEYPVLKLESKNAQVDDKVFFVGFAEMVAKSVLVGRVSASSAEDPSGGECDMCNDKRMLVQIGGGPGASGSPVISEKTGKVVGILEGHVYENGSVVVKVSSVKDFLAHAALPRTP